MIQWDKPHGGRPGSHRLRVTLSQKDPRPIVWLHERWAGTVYRIRHTKYKHCQLYEWALYGRNAGAFLKDVRPYLVLKADQADVAFAFLETLSPGHKKRQGAGEKSGFAPIKPMTAELVATRDEMRLKMQLLKRPEVA